MCIFGENFRHYWETLAQTIILRPRNLLRATVLESRKKSESSCSCKSATQLVRFASTNVLKYVGVALGGAMGTAWWDVVGYHTTPIAFSFPEILHASHVTTNTVLIQSLMHLRYMYIQSYTCMYNYSSLAY